MKISANTIFGMITSAILLFMIFWMVSVQTMHDYPDVTDEVVEARVMRRSVERGRAIFLDEGCYRCHKRDKRHGVIRGVTRRFSREWLFKFIRDEKSLIDEKDQDVLQLKEEFNWANGEHNKEDLTDQELTDILNYLESFI
ncbi:c-type cytochrome [Tenacibaculum sp. MEBiC06402]|uniref:c-type cytochrome n=1 Tax=unclassified Tenacibaculum TaxID=2635139 RepID=UPI003B9C1FFD